MSFEEQIDWMANQLKKIEKGERIQLVVEVNDQVVGSTSVQLDKEGKDHVGSFGIVLGEKYRGHGIGERAMEKALEEARDRLDVEIIVLKVYIF